MKKFTETNTEEKRYSGYDEIKNKLYNIIEETLKPTIGDNYLDLFISGKDDLVNELMKIIENKKISSSVNLLKTYKQDDKEVIVDKVIAATNSVLESIDPYLMVLLDEIDKYNYSKKEETDDIVIWSVETKTDILEFWNSSSKQNFDKKEVLDSISEEILDGKLDGSVSALDIMSEIMWEVKEK